MRRGRDKLQVRDNDDDDDDDGLCYTPNIQNVVYVDSIETFYNRLKSI